MKLLVGNGSKLEVREVGPVLYEMRAQGALPVPFWDSKIVSDEEARKILESFRAQGFRGKASPAK